MRRPSTFRALLAAFLLVGMQQAAQWHAVDHLGAWFQRAHEQALHVPTPDGPCAICALFAGGASAASGKTPSFPPHEARFVASTFTDLLVATTAPSSHQIRAPPTLL